MYTIGLDFGTLSARALLVETATGREVATATHAYAHGVMDATLAATGRRLPPEYALQDPADYVDSAAAVLRAVVAESGVNPADVVGIGVDFTASTPMPTMADGTPLSQVPGFAGEPHAYPKLWKHHASQPQADRINAVARERGEAWLSRYGGKYSSEWFWSKLLQIADEAPAVYDAFDTFIEGADWIVWQLTGVKTRNMCTAGYKMLVQDGDYPAPAFFAALHPKLEDAVGTKVERGFHALGTRAGGLTPWFAEQTGLPAGIAVAVGNIDAHATLPAVQATGPGIMVMIMGTSTCHVISDPQLYDVPGMCGVVDGGIVPGLYGYEAGQSGVGDIFAWYVEHNLPADVHAAAAAAGLSAYEYLEREAALQQPGEHGLLALDWWNGNRSTLVDTELSGLIVGLTLNTRAADIYRALIEATAYGTRAIIEAFEAAGVQVETLVAAGGLPDKNALLCQIYADVTGRPLRLGGSSQAGALGSAIHAAAAAGVYGNIAEAAAVMGRLKSEVVQPVPAHQAVYDALYREYAALYAWFGRDGNAVMKRLKAIRNTALGVG